MRNLFNPKWLFLINTLPIAVLFFLFYGEFQIIKSLLDPENIRMWQVFAGVLAILGICNFAYAVYLIIKEKNTSPYYGAVALFCYIPFIYLYGVYINEIIPISIPSWMMPDNMLLYVGTFLMPTLAYSMWLMIVYFTPESKDFKAWKSFLIAILIPISWYLFSQVTLPMWRLVESKFEMHVVLIFIIVSTLIFLFFLVRSIYIVVTKKAQKWQKYQLVWKIPLTILLPLIGLAVNNGQLFNDFGPNEKGVFGDFSSYWFYILVILNGMFLCLPNLDNKPYRLSLFIGRSILFAFTVYFFIVFLPFLPVSVFAIIALGTGFLMLSPLLLFVLHVHELSKDLRFLQSKSSPTSLWKAIAIVAFLVIPFSLTMSYLKDKNTLNQSLEYVYSPNYSKSYNLDRGSLQKTLKVIKGHKENNRGGIFGSQQPYLSSYFNWLVLDNLTLSDSKINMIEKVFFNKTPFNLYVETIQNNEVGLTDISTNSVYDKSQNAWKSWINLEITNKSIQTRPADYATTIELPEGAWISDYYLFVDDKKEMGILAEKKAAMWVFSNIRNQNKDPGILYYLTGNKVALHVFPFTKKEVRKTGFELLHKDPIQLIIDGNAISLGNSETQEDAGPVNENAIYISASAKQSLEKISRKPYFHFLVDVTSKENISDYIERITAITKTYPTLSQNAEISFVNSYVSTTSLAGEWQQKLHNQNFLGGYYLDRAIKSTLFQAYKDQKSSFPIIVAVTDSIQNAIFDKDFSDWRFSFPETDVFYNLNDNHQLEPHSLSSTPKEVIRDSSSLSLSHPVFAYKLKDNTHRYLPDNQQPSILLKSDHFEIQETDIKEKNWNSALTMHAKWTSQILHPETADKGWLSLIKFSFLSKVMTPVTSYLVVENEAQKAILKKKQQQVLSGNKSLDLGEETQRMTEPGFVLMAVLLALALWYKQRKSKRKECK